MVVVVGGGIVLSGQITYFNMSYPKKWFTWIPKPEYLFSNATKYFKNAKKEKENWIKQQNPKTQNGWGGGDQGYEEGKTSLSKVGKHEDMKTNFKI